MFRQIFRFFGKKSKYRRGPIIREIDNSGYRLRGFSVWLFDIRVFGICDLNIQNIAVCDIDIRDLDIREIKFGILARNARNIVLISPDTSPVRVKNLVTLRPKKFLVRTKLVSPL